MPVIRTIAVAAALAALAMPAPAADLGRPPAGYAPPPPYPVYGGYEVRKYAMDSGRAYGAPVREYIRFVPAPAADRVVVSTPGGPREILIDDRPDINSLEYIPVLK